MMKHLRLDRKAKLIKNFVRALSANSEGYILELNGKPVLKVFPVAEGQLDKGKLKAAILKRRDESRELNKEWAAVDWEMWEKIPEARE